MTKTLNVSSSRLLNPIKSDLKQICFSQQDAFTCLYDAYVDRIYRYVYLHVADSELAENITLQVFLEAWEKLPTYQTGKSPVISWLYSIAYNAVINQGCNQEASTQFDQANLVGISRQDNMPTERGLRIELDEHYEALKELADKQQQVLILKFICGFGTFEVAPQIEKEQGTMRSLQMYGLDGLKDEYSALQLEEIYSSR